MRGAKGRQAGALGRGERAATLPFPSVFLLPCREWVEENQLWVQQVSSTPSTRMDVVHLQEQLDLKLQQRQARETGICPVRRELYSQCFGEHSGVRLLPLLPLGPSCTSLVPHAPFRRGKMPILSAFLSWLLHLLHSIRLLNRYDTEVKGGLPWFPIFLTSLLQA